MVSTQTTQKTEAAEACDCLPLKKVCRFRTANPEPRAMSSPRARASAPLWGEAFGARPPTPASNLDVFSPKAQSKRANWSIQSTVAVVGNGRDMNGRNPSGPKSTG